MPRQVQGAAQAAGVITWNGIPMVTPPSRARKSDLLIGLNSGLPGMASIHTNSAREAITKLCTLPVLARDNVTRGFLPAARIHHLRFPGRGAPVSGGEAPICLSDNDRCQRPPVA